MLERCPEDSPWENSLRGKFAAGKIRRGKIRSTENSPTFSNDLVKLGELVKLGDLFKLD